MNRSMVVGRAGAVSVALACAVLAGSGHAQVGARSSAPIDITANEAEVINSKCVAIWRGVGGAELKSPTRQMPIPSSL